MSVTSKSRPIPEVVVFKDPTKRQNVTSVNQKPREHSGEVELRPTISLNEARRDVFKLGISKFDQQSKMEARMAKAIKLGAKPLKKPSQNYKEFMKMEKIRKEEEKALRMKNRALGLKVKKPFKPPPKKRPGAVRGFTCQVGKFEDGVQKIPNKIIRSVARSQRQVGSVKRLSAKIPQQKV